MKRILAFTGLLIILAGCAAGSWFFRSWLSDITTPKPDPYKRVVETGRRYEIYEISKGHFQYFIYDRDHRFLDCGYTDRMPPHITVSDGIVELNEYFGPGFRLYTFYDYENRLVSDSYWAPLTTCKSTVAYFDIIDGSEMIVVRDMFHKSKLFRTFERDFDLSSIPRFLDMDFTNDGKQLCISYVSGKTHRKVTETLDLY